MFLHDSEKDLKSKNQQPPWRVAPSQNFTTSPLLTFIRKHIHIPTNMTKYHVSVTGMDIISIWTAPAFISFARKSMNQAKQSDGVVQVGGTYRKGVHHTLTVWEDKESMQKYLRSGDHKEAMSKAKDIGTFVKVYGYDIDEIPTMDEALQLWEEKGRFVFKARPNDSKNTSSQTSSLRSTFLFGCTTLALLFALTKVFPMETVAEIREAL